jgi:hypothetical protein
MNEREKFYHEAMGRADAWARARSEAEAAIGEPYHGCRWHNMLVAFETGRPEPGSLGAVKAYKRLLWQEREILAASHRLNEAFYARYLSAVRVQS